MSGALALIYTTCGSESEARQIARLLLEERLIACANHLSPVLSQYEFQGAFREEREFPLLLKTARELVEPATERLLALHPFDTPAILHWEADAAGAGYEKWLRDQVEIPQR